MSKPKRAAGRPQEREPDMKTWEGRLVYRLHQAAIAKGLTSKQIAEILSTKFHIKTGPRTVDAWWGGASTPELKRLRALSIILEVSIDELLK